MSYTCIPGRAKSPIVYLKPSDPIGKWAHLAFCKLLWPKVGSWDNHQIVPRASNESTFDCQLHRRKQLCKISSEAGLTTYLGSLNGNSLLEKSE